MQQGWTEYESSYYMAMKEPGITAVLLFFLYRMIPLGLWCNHALPVQYRNKSLVKQYSNCGDGFGICGSRDVCGLLNYL